MFKPESSVKTSYGMYGRGNKEIKKGNLTATFLDLRDTGFFKGLSMVFKGKVHFG